MTPKEAYKTCEKQNKRIFELEKIILRDPEWSYYYAQDIIKGPWEEGESIIINDCEFSYLYALNIIRGPWFEGEKSIIKDSEFSYLYARNVIKGQWLKGEDSISKNFEFSYWYATIVINKPFEKCHAIIFDSFFKYDYLKFLSSVNYDTTKISEWLI